ncbi:hypothetical protein RB653_010593 [Dictyostelium firmibasis]|uniref:EF-hand domain-containing protein n=1 Tax=Dictyostelium firmibasis TaxID=79012 RepID=A0AAN7TTA8_9MYCE
MYSNNSSSDDEEKELMDEIQLNNNNLGGSFGGTIGSSSNNIGSPGGEFINQMEQVFKTIDTEENGIISLTQLRQEIESLTGESIDTNPLIGKLLNFLRIVHRAEQPKNDDEDEVDNDVDNPENTNHDDQDDFEDDSSFEDLIFDEKKQLEEDNTFIDFQSFLESMASYMDGEDPKKLREKQIEKLKLPKFKVPIDLLKKYNITPKFLSPMISGNNSPNGGNNSNNNNNNNSSGGGGGGDVYSHLNNSPSKSGGSSNKFNRLFSAKPMVTFEQFNQLITKLNYGKEIPKQKLLMHLHDLPTDKDDCIDANLFLSSFGGLNHPMSPKLTYDDDDDNNQVEKKEDQFNINSRGSGNTSPPNVKINYNNNNDSNNNNNKNNNNKNNNNNNNNNNINQWNSKNTQIVDQLQDSYKVLEREVESYQSELSMLEKSRQIQDSSLKKKDQEIDKLRKEARFVDGMRDANKDLMVQNQNLKNQLSKLTLNEELLRESIDQEKDKLREASESNVLKDLELKKLKLLLKTQQNINNKLSMMVTFSDDTIQEGGSSGTSSPNSSGSINFTSKRIKPTIDRAKQVLGRQKSEKFEMDKYSTIHANNNFSMFLKQQQVLLQEKQEKQYQQPYYFQSGTNSPQSLQSEFEELNKQQQQQPQTTTPPISQQNYDNNDEESSELDSLKKQLGGFDYQLPPLEGTYDSPSISSPSHNQSFDSPSHNQSFDSPSLVSSPPISQLISKVSDGPQPIQMMSPMTPPLPTHITSSSNLSSSLNVTPTHNNNNNNNNNNQPNSPLANEQSNRSLLSPKYIRTSSPSIKSTPSSAPMYSSTPSTSTATALLSPFSLNNPTNITGSPLNNSTNNNNNSNNNNKNSNTTTTTTTTISNNTGNSNLGYNTISSNNFNNFVNSSSSNLSSSQLIQDQFNVGSIRRLKKSDIIRLHASEMEEQNESAQMLITEAEKALEEFKKNSSLELQRLQKLLQEERQHSKMLEKQLSNQMDKNKEMVTGKDSTNTSSWGGMQNFFSFVTNYLPSTLFCNLSSTS